MKRQIIKIDEEKCNGCGLCIPECHEGALQLIEGKARLVSDLFCDGLGACIGHCPEDAITIEERKAEAYDERKVLEQMAGQPCAVLEAHLKHLLDHRAGDYYDEAVEYMKEKGIPNPILQPTANDTASCHSGGCPGSQVIDRGSEAQNGTGQDKPGDLPSELRQWPVQLHLVPPSAPFLNGRELVLMSTCGPLASANVHNDYLQGRAVLVACPKLDYTDPYTEKLTMILSQNHIPKLIIVRMEVPCCSGLTKFVGDAIKYSGNNDTMIEEHVLSIDGTLKEIKQLR